MILVLVAGLSACAIAPPVQEMSDARQAVAAAVHADAATHAPDELADAKRFLKIAEDQLRRQSYGMARLNAGRARRHAMDALDISREATQSSSVPRDSQKRR